MFKLFNDNSKLIKIVRLFHILIGSCILVLIYLYSKQNDQEFIDVINTYINFSIYFQVAMLNFLCYLELRITKKEEQDFRVLLLSFISMLFTLNFLSGFFLFLVIWRKIKYEQIKVLSELKNIMKDKKILGLYLLNITVIIVLYLTVYQIILA